MGSPKVIAYSFINEKNITELRIYYPNGTYKTKLNPSIKDIIPLIKIGDILTYTGHTKIVYDIEKDKNGTVTDGIIMQSTEGGSGNWVKTKICPQLLKLNGATFKSFFSNLFYFERFNKKFEEGLNEGSVGLARLSTFSQWVNINNPEKRFAEYSIMRFIQKDSKGNVILKYNNTNSKTPDAFKNNDIIKLPNRNKDRIKFKHLYIEKIVNINNNIVELGDILIYKIIIKNLSKDKYKNDLIVTENLSQFVEFETNYENKENILFNYDIKNKKLIWNIGKLESKEEIIIHYLVKVISGKSKDIIKSVGFVNNIPSTTIKNVIGINLNQNKKNLIIKNYEKLKNKYNGKKLINEIYKNSFNIDVKFDEFEITKLINNTILISTTAKTIYLNKNNSFYNAILNNYWSSIASFKYRYINGQQEQDIYNMKLYRDYTDPERREDYIYLETLKTGDILIYINKNDIIYSVENNKLIKNHVTYENGEYAYIYIEGKGFVGVNIGNDGKENTKDDRNEFNAKYYKN